MALKGTILVFFALIGPALAMHLMKVISVTEFVERRISQPDEDLPLFQLDPQSQKHIQYWRDRLLDQSLQVVGPCRLPEDAAHECSVPRYPLFPLSDNYRHRLLGRPPPDVVRANIEQATNGELSTVDGLVERVNANLENLNVLGDDELTLLATNFGEPKAGVTIRVGCGPINYGEWPEDILVSQYEQRALLAGSLYVLGDEEFLARRYTALWQYIHEHAKQNEQKIEQCLAGTSKGRCRFGERVEQLDAEVIITEAEWLARYNEYVAALRADLYGMVSGGPREWEYMRAKIDEVVSIAEDVVDETMECNIPFQEPGFAQFLNQQKDRIEREHPGLRRGMMRRIAYRRWKSLPLESQVVYMYLVRE